MRIDPAADVVSFIGNGLSTRSSCSLPNSTMHCLRTGFRREVGQVQSSVAHFRGPLAAATAGLQRKQRWWTGAMSLVNTILCPPHGAGQATCYHPGPFVSDTSCSQVLEIDLFRQTCALVGRYFGDGEAGVGSPGLEKWPGSEAKYRAVVQSNDGCFYCPPCNGPQAETQSLIACSESDLQYSAQWSGALH